jgi:Ca2+:H+ antiporter
VVPLAHLMGVSTEHLAAKAGPTWGGLLNATFGNAAELIIGVIALSKGLNGVVKASLTGSILGNLLLVAGAAIVAGGWRREKQTINPAAVEANGGLLMIGVAAMLVPAIFHFTGERLGDVELVRHEHNVSVATCIVLVLVYVAGLLFTLRTHAHLFSPAERTPKPSPAPSPVERESDRDVLAYTAAPAREEGWTVRFSIVMLLLASAGIAVVAELLVGSAEALAHRFGWNEVFVGVILLAIVGNAAEHSTAVMLAVRDDMDTAMTIVFQSSLQIALFATPVLVFTSAAMVAGHVGNAHEYLDLVFTPMEVVSVALAVITVVMLARDGQTNWFEGVLILGLYVILAVAFFYLPAGAAKAE